MLVLFASFLLFSLIFAGGVAFASEHMRPRLKWLLFLALLGAWLTMGVAVREIVSRTAATVVTPGGARQPHLIDPATREALMLLFSLGGPVLVATALGVLALRATRPGRARLE